MQRQCAAVSFVAGTGPAGGEAGCKNASGVTMMYVALSSDANLAPFANGASPSTGNSPTAPSMSPSATHMSGSAASMRLPVGLGAAGVVAWALCLL